MRNSESGLKIKDQIELHVSDAGVDRLLSAAVLSVDGNNIYIDRSDIDEKMLSLIIGCDVKVVLKKSGGSFWFKSPFAQFGKINQIPVLKFPIPEKWERVQRRSYSRLSVEIPIYYRWTDLSPEQKDGIYKDGVVVNISAGGIKFRLSASDIWGYQTGSILDVKLHLSDPDTIIETKALILESSLDKGDEDTGMLVCRFLKISDAQKEAITIHNIRFQQKFKIESRKNTQKTQTKYSSDQIQKVENLKIHKSAIISSKAKLGTDVSVGAFSIIEDDVSIGNETRIDSSVLIANGARLGKGCEVSQGVVLATKPQDLKFGGEESELRVGDRTVLREYCTLNRGTEHGGGITQVGSDCLLMAYTHVAHDCKLGNQVILANAINMAGHVNIEDNVIIGGITAIHQFVKIGKYAFIGGLSRVTQDVPPYILTTGDPLKYYGPNSIGLKRQGFTTDQILSIKRSYKLIYRSKLNLVQAVDAIKNELELTKEVEVILDFIENSDRGIIKG